MRAAVDVDCLKGAASWAAKRCMPRPHRPELAGVLVGVHEGDALTLDATDLVSAGSATVRCDTVEAGEALVNAAVLAAISAQLPGDVAKMHVDGDRLRVTSGTARFSLRLMRREDFPALPQASADASVVSGSDLAGVLTAVASAVGRDDARPVLTGVHLGARDGRLVAAATDSYRLHIASLPWPGSDVAALIPGDVARAVAKDCAADKVEVAVDGPRASFGMGPHGIVTNVVEGTFPDYPQLIPTERAHRVTVQAPALAQVVRRCATVAPDQSSGGTLIRLRIADGEVAVVANSAYGGGTGDDAFDSVEADTDGADLTVACNSKYVVEALAAVAPDGGDVTVDLRDELKPFVLRAEGADGPDDPLALVMPVRI